MLQVGKFFKHTKEEVKERFYDSWWFSYNKLLKGSYLEKSSIAIVNMIPVLIQFYSLELSVAIGVAQYCLLKYGDLTLITIKSPTEAYLLFDPPNTFIHSTLFAPVLSATASSVCICIIFQLPAMFFF